MALSVTVDMDELRALERKLGTIGRPAAERALGRAAPYVQRQASAAAPRRTGALSRSLMTSGGGLEARVHSTLSYAMPAEFGRRAGAPMPPSSAFTGGFAAARSVARRGVKGRFFMRRAITMLRNVEMPRLLGVAVAEIESAWGKR